MASIFADCAAWRPVGRPPESGEKGRAAKFCTKKMQGFRLAFQFARLDFTPDFAGAAADEPRRKSRPPETRPLDFAPLTARFLCSGTLPAAIGLVT
ncbi:hypothetical protein [Jiella avicenniae]|uniref:Uncharacterized protein n=1 Tax=Jiella avicenniae TaxID=2907202 RepID=A0A9X1P300_9HYPH|nr:hypothetical protein [Jiella avicenniae]MCE7030107.1 hypothetical protein [Jiella avicenniae]